MTNYLCRFCGNDDHKENECRSYPEVVRLDEKLADARRERDELAAEVASEQRWARTYQDKLIQTEEQLAAANKALLWLWDSIPVPIRAGSISRVEEAVAAAHHARAAEGSK